MAEKSAQEKIIARFLQKKAGLLSRKLDTRSLIQDLYAEEVLHTDQREELLTKRNAGSSNATLTDLLLMILETKSHQERRSFLDVVHERQPELVQEVLAELKSCEAESPVKGAPTVAHHTQAPAAVVHAHVQRMQAAAPAMSPETRKWRHVCNEISKAVNTFYECTTLALYLNLNEGFSDVVEQKRQQNPLSSTCGVTCELLIDWLQRNKHKSREWKRKTLFRVLDEKLKRRDLAEVLDEQLEMDGSPLDDDDDEDDGKKESKV